MGVDSKHPEYQKRYPDWIQMRDTYGGDRPVKDKGPEYLPPTSGMIADGAIDSNGLENVNSPGWRAYFAYRMRARFPELVTDAVEALMGVMHNKPPKIELPPEMEFMREKATTRNESLEVLLRRINEEQLVMGRVGVLADVVDKGEDAGKTYLSTYPAENIINWDDGSSNESMSTQNLNMVALDETTEERTDQFNWERVQKYRVLMLGDPTVNEPLGDGIYTAGIFKGNQLDFNMENMVPALFKGTALNEIPFVFINSKDIVAKPDKPPLLDLSNLGLTIYRGDADYRQALFMQGQDTLVIVGSTDDSDETRRVGAGSTIYLPIGGSAEYIGVKSEGIPEMREALQNDYNRASEKSGKFLDTVSREKESGEALRVRVAAKTATLYRIALAGAFGLQHILRIIARWIGANPELVIVAPNLDFVDDQMSGQEVVQLMSAKSLRAPLSMKSIHATMMKRGLTEMTFEEEVKEIEAEADLELGGDPEEPGSTNPNGPEDDAEQEEEESQDEE